MSADPGKPGRDQRLRRSQRLTRPSSFQEAYRQGKKYIGRYMVLWILEQEDASLRLGVVTSRKVGNAVKRSRARRRLRELYRRRRADFQGSCDVVLVARASLPGADWGQLEQELDRLARKAGLLGSSSS